LIDPRPLRFGVGYGEIRNVFDEAELHIPSYRIILEMVKKTIASKATTAKAMSKM
jgi:hypothetical protein